MNNHFHYKKEIWKIRLRFGSKVDNIFYKSLILRDFSLSHFLMNVINAIKTRNSDIQCKGILKAQPPSLVKNQGLICGEEGVGNRFSFKYLWIQAFSCHWTRYTHSRNKIFLFWSWSLRKLPIRTPQLNASFWVQN